MYLRMQAVAPNKSNVINIFNGSQDCFFSHFWPLRKRLASRDGSDLGRALISAMKFLFENKKKKRKEKGKEPNGRREHIVLIQI